MLTLDFQFDRPGFSLTVDFVQRSAITGVYGPSGAGKSTLLHVIAGLAQPVRGLIQIGDRRLASDNPPFYEPPHLRRVGMVFQDARLFPHLSVRENLLYGHPERGTDVPAEDLKRIANVLEITPMLDRRPRELSGGEAQRVAIGRALLAKPRVLLLDEPLANLDRRLRATIVQLLRRVHEIVRVPMLYVSHELEEILQLTDHLLLLDRGRVVSHDAYHILRHDPRALEVIHDRGLTNVIPARITRHDAEGGLTHLTIGNGEDDSLDVAGPYRPDLPIGQSVRIGIRPADISLSLHRLEGISIRNQMPSRIARLTPHAGRTLIELDGGESMIAEVSPQTVQELGLEQGGLVWRLVKSNAVRYLS